MYLRKGSVTSLRLKQPTVDQPFNCSHSTLLISSLPQYLVLNLWGKVWLHNIREYNNFMNNLKKGLDIPGWSSMISEVLLFYSSMQQFRNPSEHCWPRVAEQLASSWVCRMWKLNFKPCLSADVIKLLCEALAYVAWSLAPITVRCWTRKYQARAPVNFTNALMMNYSSRHMECHRQSFAEWSAGNN